MLINKIVVRRAAENREIAGANRLNPRLSLGFMNEAGTEMAVPDQSDGAMLGPDRVQQK